MSPQTFLLSRIPVADVAYLAGNKHFDQVLANYSNFPAFEKPDSVELCVPLLNRGDCGNVSSKTGRFLGRPVDQILVAIPAGADYDLAVEKVDRILCDAMQQICPNIPIKTESLLADRWYKDEDEQPIGKLGNIVPFSKYRDVPDPLLAPLDKKKLSRSAYDPDSIWSFCLP